MLFNIYVYHIMFYMDIFSVPSSLCLNPNARPFVPVCNKPFSERKHVNHISTFIQVFLQF